jgi:small subunit ribosomal protein S18
MIAMQKTTNNVLAKPKSCYFCINSIIDINYKDVQTLRRFISSYSKIVPRKRSAVCSKHQRQLALAIKRARVMALLPITTK